MEKGGGATDTDTHTHTQTDTDTQTQTQTHHSHTISCCSNTFFQTPSPSDWARRSRCHWCVQRDAVVVAARHHRVIATHPLRRLPWGHYRLLRHCGQPHDGGRGPAAQHGVHVQGEGVERERRGSAQQRRRCHHCTRAASKARVSAACRQWRGLAAPRVGRRWNYGCAARGTETSGAFVNSYACLPACLPVCLSWSLVLHVHSTVFSVRTPTHDTPTHDTHTHALSLSLSPFFNRCTLPGLSCKR